MCVYAGVFAAVTLGAHVKYTRDQWSTSSNYLRALMLLGCLGQLAAVCAFAVYLTLAISQQQRSSVPYKAKSHDSTIFIGYSSQFPRGKSVTCR